MSADRDRMAAFACFAVLLLAYTLLVLHGCFFLTEIQDIMLQLPIDLTIFAQQGEQFWRDGTLYQRAENLYMAYLPNAAIYKFPPVFQLYIAPWLKAGIPASFYDDARWFFVACYLLAVILLVGYSVKPLLCRRHVAIAGRWRAWVFVALALTIALQFAPFFNALSLGAAEIPLLLLLVLVVLCVNRKPMFAGVLLAMAATAKIYPAFMLVYLLWGRHWRAIAATAIFAIVLSVAAVAVFSLRESAYYTGRILPLLLSEHPMGVTENLNLVFYFFRGGITHDFARSVFFCMRAVFLLLFVAFLYKARRDDAVERRLNYALVVVTMLMLMSNYWLQYQLLLLIPALLVLGHAWAARQWPALLLALMALLSMAMRADQVYKTLAESYSGDAAALSRDLYLYGEWQLMLIRSPVSLVIRGLDSLKPLAPHMLFLSTLLLMWRERRR